MNIVYAATAAEIANPIIDKIKVAILYPLISLMMGVALLVFLWGVFEYIAGADGDQARETGKRHMFYGIIGLVVMVSAFAILEIATATFGVTIPS